ncbi:hypothetical protein GTQ43_37920 [Nostoc sp. KVJ3]|uniref:hypothetical protein n=1 Tax=Nostoc sp. KVJ3 TaxID=457945 RepID=UPI002238357B|nr:hypothetical protein [Nostoc sp. KVJ3]MCW5319173.1 hypothetical protein [Nostoc sp. KVJ3]
MSYLLLRDLFQVRQYKPVPKKQLSKVRTPLILIGFTLAIGVIGIASYFVVRKLIVQQLQEKALLQVLKELMRLING